MDQSPRFALPFLAPGQAQKELSHNEAIQRIDALLCPVVEGGPQPDPPENATIGACYLVAAAATAEWAGQDGAIACMTEGGWRFVAPKEGVIVHSAASGEPWQWRGGAWDAGVVRAQEVQIGGQPVLRQRQPAIADPSGGSVIDGESRMAVAAILAALRAHGLIG